MAVAYNHDTGEALALGADGEWSPTKVAVNPDTGERLALSSSGEWHPIPPPSGGVLGTVDDIARAAASGASFGFADKLDAAIKAPFMDKTYEELVRENQARGENFYQSHPALSIGSNVAGGIAGVVAAPAIGAAKAAPYLAKVPSFIKSVGVGSGMGALGGAGTAPPGEELAGAEHGALLGAGFGAALPVVGKAIGSTVGPVAEKAVDKIRSAFSGTLDSIAARKVAQAFERDGIDPKTIPQLLEAYGPGATLVDVGGENVLMLAKAASNLPGPQKQMASDLVAARRAGRGNKLVGALEENIEGGDFHSAMQGWMEKRAAESAPLYEKAYSVDFVSSPKLDSILKKPSVKDALPKAYRLAAEEGTDPMALGLALNEAGDVIFTKAPSMKTWDYIKRGLDDVIEGKKNPLTGKLDNEGRLVNSTRKDLLSELDSINPDYAAARSAYAGPSHLMEAAEAGRKFASKDPEVTTKLLESLNDSEKAAFRIGVFQKLKSDILSNTATAAGKFDETKARMLDQLAPTFPTKDAFEAFKGQAQKVLAEARRDAAINPRGGSHTAALNAAFGDLEKDPSPFTSAAGNLLHGNWMNAAKDVLHGIGGALTNPPEKVAGPVGGILLATQQSPALSRYLQAPKGVFGLPRMPQYSGAALGGGGLGAISSPE